MLSLSVIIPTINEVDKLPILLASLNRQKNINLDVLVVDGGSTDATTSVAEKMGARTIRSDKGRARQLNTGAAQAACENLLFLHADSIIDNENFLQQALEAFKTETEDTYAVAGHFPLKFSHQPGKHHLAFRYLEEKTATNRPYTINGDQGLLIRRDFFVQLGGYDESLPMMEDQAIAAKIFSNGRWVVLPGILQTSGRRFETEGFHRRYLLMSLMMGLYWTGAHQFFQRAKNSYVDQGDAEQLKLWPFFRCIWQMLIQDFGWKRSFIQWYRVGRYVRQNSWQLFFFFDVALRAKLGQGAYPYTRFHDRLVSPVTDNILFNVLVTPMVFIWYMIVLGPAFFLIDLKGR
jgi:rSAM/selenodomain-associated transferase 2